VKMKTKVKNSKQNEKQNTFAEDLIDVLTVENDKRENHLFRRNAWTFMKFIPRLHTTWHMCVFHDQYTLTNDILHIALCVTFLQLK
jgi:hypothetical protein